MNLSEINFSNADLRKCNMESVVMRDSDLSYAMLSGTKLIKADIRGTRLDGVYMSDVKMSRTKIDLEQAVLMAEGFGCIIS